MQPKLIEFTHFCTTTTLQDLSHFFFTAGSLNGGAVVSGEEGGKERGGGGVKSGGGMDGGQNLEQVFICISPSSSSFIDAAKESLPDKRHGKDVFLLTW